MSVDFPRAWQICRATPKEKHHESCSYRTHGMLCDCFVLFGRSDYMSQSFYGLFGVEINHP